MAPSPRERAQLQAEMRHQQEALLLDLLPVLDALDRAETHWHQAITHHHLPRSPAGGWWLRLRQALVRLLLGQSAAIPAEAGRGTARQALEGIRLIRSTLLEALERHGVEPIHSLGQPFDPERMLALGQQPAPAGVAAGMVVDEAVRGYLWRQALLREAQVLVSGP